MQVVGVPEDGKYASLTEDPKPVMFLPLLPMALQLRLPGGGAQAATRPSWGWP